MASEKTLIPCSDPCEKDLSILLMKDNVRPARNIVRPGTALLLMLLMVWVASAEASSSVAQGDSILRVLLYENQVLFGFEKAAFERDMVVSKRGGGDNFQLIRWQYENNTVVLHTPVSREHESRPDWLRASTPVARFPEVACEKLHAAICIDATILFIPENAPIKWRLATHTLPVKLDSAVNFPENVVIGAIEPGRGERKAWIKWSFVPLPKKVMSLRMNDRRFGYLDTEYMSPESQLEWSYVPPILRWRMQQDGLSQITMHVDPNTPRRWVPWMMKGIESWRPAFAAAGWRNAIRAVDAADISDWNFDDVRYSAMCWGRRQGCGWIIFDPRTGEILQFQMDSAQSAAQNFLARYVVTMAGVDQRILSEARSDEIVGALVQQVTAHEMGHALGLRDGHFGSGAYTIDQVRSLEWGQANGVTPSIMNYTRFNYVLQPEDSFSPEMAIPTGIGVGDIHAIRRGYEPLEALPKYGLEMPTHWLLEQAANPAYRYTKGFIRFQTPSEVAESVGTSDLIEESRLGVRNLERSLGLIDSRKIFPDDDEVAEWLQPELLFDAAIEQWGHMVRPVMSMVGAYQPRPGINADMARVQLDASEVVPVNAEAQRKAMSYLCTNVFPESPSFLVKGLLLQHAGITSAQAEDRLRTMRYKMLNDTLLQTLRLERLIEAEKADSGEFGIVDFVRSLRECIVRSGE